MKVSLFIPSIALALLMLIPVEYNAQDFPKLDKSPMDVAAFPSNYDKPEKLIKITYSRPQLNGRPISDLTPVGKVWRTGANEAAELTLYKKMVFGNTKIDEGTYTFYLIPGEDTWTAIISKDLNVWGSYFYDQNNDVARIEVPLKKAKESIEVFSIVFEDSKSGLVMHIGWEKIRLAVPFQIP